MEWNGATAATNTQENDGSELTDDEWGEGENRRGSGSSVSSDSSVSTLMMDAALASETNDLAAQV